MGKLFDTVVKHKFFSNKSSLKVKSCTFYHKGRYNLRKVPKGKKVRHLFFFKGSQWLWWASFLHDSEKS